MKTRNLSLTRANHADLDSIGFAADVRYDPPFASDQVTMSVVMAQPYLRM